jgi:transcriptional regulator GlxA family with amidase domain
MRTAFLLYDKVTALDLVGPYEVLSRLPGMTTLCVARQRGPVSSGSGLQLYADCSLEDVNSADILVVPGAATATALRDAPELLEWIQKIDRSTCWTTSVCTGSLILGAAGLLKGKKATSHWAVLERLAHWGATPVHCRVVEDGKLITAAGVSAGIDMALILAAKIAGNAAAREIQLTIEYDPQPPFDSGSPNKAAPETVQSVKARTAQRFEPA